ncbi:MAG: FAD-binding domain-containing protein [Sumerlaeia bacterium]
MTSIVWFKRDLRLHDHLPLLEAVRRGPCVCLYIYEPLVLEDPCFEASHLGFLNESLEVLQAQLLTIGGRLITRRGEAISVLQQLHHETGFQRLYSHEETGQWTTYQRDVAVARWAKTAGIEWQEFPTNGVVRHLKSRDGWSAIWGKRMSMPVLQAPNHIHSPEGLETAGIINNALELCVKPTVKTNARQKGGTTEASELLESFFQGRGQNYSRGISSPLTAEHSCSRLSPYLTFGCLSVKQVHQACQKSKAILRQSTLPEARRLARSVTAFDGRMHWHCHFIQKLEQRPELEFENLVTLCNDLREGEFNPDYFEAWQQGRTGFPMIDACMRSLIATGWLNFRMRAMLVSFASYHLWLDWRQTSKFLGRHFLDYEPGIHYSQIQMQSGTAGHSVLRMYNPTKQGQDHDPQGEFIRRWLPELEGVPTAFLHEPWRLTNGDQTRYNCQIGKDYPAPIIDQKAAITYARQRFTQLRQHPAFQQQAKRIQQQIGSRKKSPPTRQSATNQGANQNAKPRTRKTRTPDALQADLFDP